MTSGEPLKQTSKQKTGSYELLRATGKRRARIFDSKDALSITSGSGRSAERVLWSRHELKYLISEAKAAAIVEFIRPYVRLDRYCLSQPSAAYPVVSLYLDSEDLRLCRESLTGQKNRFKLRIRSYTDALDYPRFFEVKRRITAIIVKSRTRVFHRNVAGLLLGMLVPPQGSDAEDESLLQFILYMHRVNAKPILRTRYLRQAFEGVVDNRVRVTLDRNLCYKVTPSADLQFDGPGWQRMHQSRVILEIKFTGQYPPWLSRMVVGFNLRQQSLSKYASSVKKACLLGFCGLKIRTY